MYPLRTIVWKAFPYVTLFLLLQLTVKGFQKVLWSLDDGRYHVDHVEASECIKVWTRVRARVDQSVLSINPTGFATHHGGCSAPSTSRLFSAAVDRAVYVGRSRKLQSNPPEGGEEHLYSWKLLFIWWPVLNALFASDFFSKGKKRKKKLIKWAR